MALETDMKQLIIELAQRSLKISRCGLIDEPPAFARPEASRFLSPATVLALNGEREWLDFFCRKIVSMAEIDWGVQGFVIRNGLNDAFAARSFTECYKMLLRCGLLTEDAMSTPERQAVEKWLYRLAHLRASGDIARLPDFVPNHNCNQCVPATMVYEIADLLDTSALAHNLDTQPLWQWADEHTVLWDYNWRTPDDAWLYQFIWNWSAYRHAALRRPELLQSENARRSFEYYKILWAPGARDLVYGDSKTGDLLAAATSLTLGAHLFQDGEQKWLAEKFLQRVEAQGYCRTLVDRGPEFHRIYTLWPEELEATPPARRSLFLESPLAGRGWSLGGAPYNEAIKNTDPRFPECGKSINDYDAIYQERDENLYATPRPDKLIFAEEIGDDALFALADLRAQGIHDHPDALGVSTLIGDGVPWLVESNYMPRGFNRQRWLHNVPLYRRGHVSPEELRTHDSDTWREVAPGDAEMERRGGLVIAQARIPHDAFDYLNFDGDLFDIERTFLFDPQGLFVVIDRLRAAENGLTTLAQAWHTPAQIEMQDTTARLSHSGKTWHASFAQSTPMRCEHMQHEPTQFDEFYFTGDIQDLLWHTQLELQQGETYIMVAAFSREPVALSIDEAKQIVHCNRIRMELGEFGQRLKWKVL